MVHGNITLTEMELFISRTPNLTEVSQITPQSCPGKVLRVIGTVSSMDSRFFYILGYWKGHSENVFLPVHTAILIFCTLAEFSKLVIRKLERHWAPTFAPIFWPGSFGFLPQVNHPSFLVKHVTILVSLPFLRARAVTTAVAIFGLYNCHAKDEQPVYIRPFLLKKSGRISLSLPNFLEVRGG